MAKLLALDVGTRRTGVAYADTEIGIPFPKKTIRHKNIKELINEIIQITSALQIDCLIIGWPLLLSGRPGKQAKFVQEVKKRFENKFKTKVIDERYTTKKNAEYDRDAASACELLSTYLQNL